MPNGGAGRNPPNSVQVVTGQRLPAARAALRRTPLWLGRSFHGRRLASVVVGREGQQSQKVSGENLPAVGCVRFARFDYGSFAVWEFRDRPFWDPNSPPAGKLVLTGGDLMLARDGLGLDIRPTGAKFAARPRATALALAKALRPVDG